MGRVDAAAEEATGLEHLMASVMNGSSGVIAASHQRELISDFGVFGEDLGDRDRVGTRFDRFEGAADFGGRVGLGVERIHLAWGAQIENHDRAAVVGFGIDLAIFFGGDPLGQRKADRAEGADLQKVAPQQPIAIVGGASSG